ncbi:type I-F CRISPR-associated helicase Cas3f [Litoribrevibacter euphylliae]|uniref:Type I-F CRISPR-associated helicase Cas3f n=1 Tax=Litoribrevibacter euphylliae TaxID=1834034 RepID=A0ABV7HAU7_9GAMM
MMVIFVSQCEKNALKKTRRVLDAFADRIGDNTWQTVITQEGLDAVKKLLRKTASKSTAVSCHWVRSRSRSDLLWVVGKRDKFDEVGRVPVNTTDKEVHPVESQWHTLEAIRLLSSIAALFHDFGKANKLFQKKIDATQKTPVSEPYRHEWVSLRMFEAFVMSSKKGDSLNDRCWLEKLSLIQPSDEKGIWNKLIQDSSEEAQPSPFKTLPPMAQTVAWLILTHHKLPQRKDTRKESSVPFKHTDFHLTKYLKSSWNSPQCEKEGWRKSDFKQVWDVNNRSPIKSLNWCVQARKISDRTLRYLILTADANYLNDKFTLHLSRLSLMLADHHYSSQDANPEDQDKNYSIYANTDRDTGQFKQKLDEHLIGVQRNTLKFVNALPDLKVSLPSLNKVRALEERSKAKPFKWQNKASDLAVSLAEESEENGFFGVNMASTGKGKTLANAKIMYGLSSRKAGCRFSIALGLRALTLQTGEALKSRLRVTDEELAVLIGSQAVKQLYDENQAEYVQDKAIDTGSESETDILQLNQNVIYNGYQSDGPLEPWLANRPKLQKLLNAPILVSTIDHLMPATEAQRGGKQIAPMLRLLTSDLILDEPDDFDVEDTWALTRMVNWAGMLGARVLLSSATLPPDTVHALFDSYREGRQHFNQARGKQTDQVCCAWFDEFQSTGSNVSSSETFKSCHQEFIDDRVQELLKAEVTQRSKLVNVPITTTEASDVIRSMGNTVLDCIYQLHDIHKESNNEGTKSLSLGLVRMANINPLVALAKYIAQQPVKKGYQLHLCVYHGQQPLIVRSSMEHVLDRVFDRHNPEALWEHSEIHQALKHSDAQHHIFIVLGTSVMEVGRDWDASWGIAEPSSMRSIIQFAGRINRHRRIPATEANLVLLNTNYRALNKPGDVAFCRPGFEKETLKLSSHDLNAVLLPEHYETIRSIPRINKSEELDIHNRLVDLEHQRLNEVLINRRDSLGASIWWEKPCHHTYLLQGQTRFRVSMPSTDYFLNLEDESDQPVFHAWHTSGEHKPSGALFDMAFDLEEGRALSSVSFWATNSYSILIEQRIGNDAQEKDRLINCMTFGAISLRNLKDTKQWQYSERYGVHQSL